MKRTVDIRDARRQLSRLIDAAVRGERIVIARAGRPLVTLTPIAKPRRTLGLAKGRGRVTKVFFDPLPADVIESFEAPR